VSDSDFVKLQKRISILVGSTISIADIQKAFGIRNRLVHSGQECDESTLAVTLAALCIVNFARLARIRTEPFKYGPSARDRLIQYIDFLVASARIREFWTNEEKIVFSNHFEHSAISLQE
jgi:hypothetical protein